MPSPLLFTEKFVASLAPLSTAFYQRKAPVVARDLLGKGLVVRHDDRLAKSFGVDATMLVEIVEVEAYLGGDDPASHAFSGPTRRNQPMFDAGGVCYVYLSYGINYCMNVVTGKAGVGEAVLIRAAAPVKGWEQMLLRRRKGQRDQLPSEPPTLLLNGPGKLTQSLGIDLRQNGWSFDRADFKIVDLGRRPMRRAIVAAPRIGITKAAELPLRFYVKDSPWLSRRHIEPSR